MIAQTRRKGRWLITIPQKTKHKFKFNSCVKNDDKLAYFLTTNSKKEGETKTNNNKSQTPLLFASQWAF
jgi:hypothetical protein